MDSKTEQNSTRDDLVRRVREKMAVYVKTPPEKRAEAVRKAGKT
jgi:hypothetical protein